jgi:hypothetical protein|nr:MAG TPA: hypothetical protein [Caudoviricetes sp.]
MKKYIMVSFPEIQEYMEHPRWNECIFCQSITGHEVPDSTYMVPEDLYTFVLSQKCKCNYDSNCSSAKEFAEKHLGEIFIYNDYRDSMLEVIIEGYLEDSLIISFVDEEEGKLYGWTNLDSADILLRESPNEYFFYIGIEDLYKKD